MKDAKNMDDWDAPVIGDWSEKVFDEDNDHSSTLSYLNHYFTDNFSEADRLLVQLIFLHPRVVPLLDQNLKTEFIAEIHRKLGVRTK